MLRSKIRRTPGTVKKAGKYHPYKNKLEYDTAAWLTEQGIPFEYERKTIKYVKVCKYLTDFAITLKNGIILETKGWFLSGDRTKHLLIQEQHPDEDIRFVFQKAGNKLNKKSTTTYGDWCDKNGFKYCEGAIPLSWFREDNTKAETD